MKKLIVTLGRLLIALLAFAQPNSTDKKQETTTTEPIEVTGIDHQNDDRGSVAASYQRAQYARCSGGQRLIRAVMFSTGVVTL